MSNTRDPGPLIELKRGRNVKGRVPKLGPAERIRAARRVPQAVVKVVSFASGVKNVYGLVDYIGHQGELTLETETGELIQGKDEENALVRSWARDFDQRKNGRDTAHIVFSTPAGTDVEALRATVRDVLADSFEGHSAVFGIHDEDGHPHAHVAVVMRHKLQEKKLALRKDDLYELRETFAEKARLHGIEMAVSPRAARGVATKGDRLSLHHMRKVGRTPHVDLQAANDVMRELATGVTPPTPWEEAIARRHRKEKQAYVDLAEGLKTSAKTGHEPKRKELLRLASELETFASGFSQGKTRRQKAIAEVKKLKEKPKDQGSKSAPLPPAHEK